MSELSHFEKISAVTPKKQPYAILIGTVILVIVLWLLNQLTPSEGVKDLKEAQKKQDSSSATRVDDDGDEI